MESHFYHDKGWQLAGWEYLAPKNGSPPYCSKSMHAYSTWRGQLTALEKELLQYVSAAGLVTCPESLSEDLLEYLPQVEDWFKEKTTAAVDVGGVADGGAADGEQVAIAVPIAGPPAQVEQGPSGAAEVQTVQTGEERATAAVDVGGAAHGGAAAGEEGAIALPIAASQAPEAAAASRAPEAAAREAEQGPSGAAEGKKKRKEKVTVPKDLPTMLVILEHLIEQEPEPGCRRPYGVGPGFCNSTVQHTCCRPPSCKCPDHVDLERLSLTKKQVVVAMQSRAVQCTAVQCKR